MEYKRTYTQEEVKALYDWYDTTQPQGSFDLGHGLKIIDVRDLFENTRTIAMEKCDNSTYSGQIHTLFLVQEAIAGGAALN